MSEIEEIVPVLVYDDIQAAHDFLVRAFGFEPGGVDHDGEGNAVHAEVRAGGQAIWLHRVTGEHRMGSPATAPSSNGMVVFVTDVDAHFRRARESGAAIDSEPADQPYGQREYGARDPEGHRWWFATRLAVAAATGDAR
ncbi:MAG: VOC family protein [Gemmatimonadetes bacterium]|nr:VOC family protein [Gemmatimonadota bacterium]